MYLTTRMLLRVNSFNPSRNSILYDSPLWLISSPLSPWHSQKSWLLLFLFICRWIMKSSQKRLLVDFLLSLFQPSAYYRDQYQSFTGKQAEIKSDFLLIHVTAELSM